MPIMDGGQPRPDPDNSNENDREDPPNKRKRVRDRSGQYAKYGKAHYEKNKAEYLERTAKNNKIKKDEWTAFKNSLSCTKCGENHPATFDFHHVVRDKDSIKVNKLVKGRMFTRAMKEVKERCIVLCANCHRKLHWEEDQNKKGAEAPSPTATT